MAYGWLVLKALVVVALAVLLLKLIRILRGDADLSLQRKSLVPDFYKGKVVWVTGASSGSTSELYTVVHTSYNVTFN